MTLMRTETRNIGPDVEGYPQIAVKITESGKEDRHGTFRPPLSLDPAGIAAHEACIARMIDPATFRRIETFYKVGETESGFKHTIFLAAGEAETKE